MYKKILIFCSFLLIFNYSCKKEKITEHKDIKALIVNTPNLPAPPPPQSATAINSNDIVVNEDGVEYTCSETTYSYAENMDNVIAFNPNSGTLYPGSLVQGKFVRDGILNSIGDFQRNPVTITIDNYGLSSTINNPSNATITSAILGLINNNQVSTIAKIAYKQIEAYSTEQAMLGLGIDYKWASGSVGGSFNVNNSHITHTIMIYFMQEYYTVSINQPSDPSNFFGDDVKAEDLSSKISSDNPLTYVSSVTYGRFLLAKISSTSTIDEMKSAINASIGKVGGQLSYTESEILKNSSYEVYIIGGNATDAINAATQGMSGIVQYMNNGANFSINSLGFPISYVVRHASDNSIIKMGKALEYTVRDNCYYDPNSYQKFQIYFDRFYVGGDCDEGVFTNTGAGEFTYTINIKDNNSIKKTISKTSSSDVLNNENLYISAGPYEVIVSKDSNHKLVISGCLYEWDDNVSTNLCWSDMEFYYPWTEIGQTATTYEKLIDNGTDCWSKLYFTIKKMN